MLHTPYPDTSYSSTYYRIFLDLLRRNAYTSRIWVELIWVTNFWLMELGTSASSPLATCTLEALDLMFIFLGALPNYVHLL